MKGFGVALLLFCLVCSFSSSQEPPISGEEALLVLNLLNDSDEAILTSLVLSESIDESAEKIGNYSSNSLSILQHSNLTISDLKITTGQLSENSNESEGLTENLEGISSELEEISQELRPPFWRSPGGQVLKWTLVVGGSFAAGWIANEVVDAIKEFL